MIRRTLATHAPAANLLIRFMVGGIFFFEGIQKFLYPADLGSGRFAKIGIPAPEFFGPFVGFFETACGLLLLAGLFTRIASVPLICTMLVALFTVKIPILIGAEFMGFSLRPLSRYGFLSMIHESRNDISMLFGSLYLLITGADPMVGRCQALEAVKSVKNLGASPEVLSQFCNSRSNTVGTLLLALQIALGFYVCSLTLE